MKRVKGNLEKCFPVLQFLQNEICLRVTGGHFQYTI